MLLFLASLALATGPAPSPGLALGVSAGGPTAGVHVRVDLHPRWAVDFTTGAHTDYAGLQTRWVIQSTVGGSWAPWSWQVGPWRSDLELRLGAGLSGRWRSHSPFEGPRRGVFGRTTLEWAPRPKGRLTLYLGAGAGYGLDTGRPTVFPSVGLHWALVRPGAPASGAVAREARGLAQPQSSSPAR